MSFEYKCPNCDSEDLHRGILQETEKGFEQHYTCLECDADLYLEFELSKVRIERW